MRDAVIVDVVRTATGKGKPGGVLSGTHPVDLLAEVLIALAERTGIDPDVIDDVVAGCVVQASEQALNIGRSAVLAAGWPERIPATTIDRQCGSSQQAAHFAAQAVMAGVQDVVVACGVEVMSRVPMGTSPMGQDTGGRRLAERYPDGLVNQGISAELITARWGLDRARLDEFAAESHARAVATTEAGLFSNEIVPVPITLADGSTGLHVVDETMRAATTAAGLGALNPSFRTEEVQARYPGLEWAITPGNSSPLTDGASAALIMSSERAAQLGLRPRARFHSFSVVGSDPLYMLTGPIPATEQVLKRSGLTLDDLDAYEVNEAFAPVPLAWAAETGADPAKLNPHGGAIALGHPLGASGTKLLATLVNHLEQTGGRYGLQTMCEGAGMANATIIEML